MCWQFAPPMPHFPDSSSQRDGKAPFSRSGTRCAWCAVSRNSHHIATAASSSLLRLRAERRTTIPSMKQILLFTALTLGALPVSAQQAPNRENLGGTPGAASGGVPASPDNLPGESGRSEIASDKSPDENFIRKAGPAGQMAVRMGEMAMSKASREDIKAFAAMLVKDHTAANASLGEIAKSMGVEIPGDAHAGSSAKSAHAKPANDPSGRQQTESVPRDPSKDKESAADKHSELKDKSGMAFDTAFLEAMEKCHKDDIALFEKAEASVKNPALKAFIEKTLPVLKSHATALTALERKDPSRPDARTGAPSATPSPSTPAPGGSSPNR